MTKIHPEGRLRDEVLRRLEQIEGSAWTNRLPPAAGFSSEDRRRITEYIGGITRRRRYLDFLIEHYSSRRQALDPAVRQVLRIGTYELVELGRPAHSAVFASVEQAKRLMHGGVGKFVNGNLRAMGRDLESLPRPVTGDAAVDAAIEFSHPDWMARRWVNRYGLAEARELMASNNRRPLYSLRVNTLKTTVAEIGQSLDGLGVSWTRSEYLDEFIRVSRLQAVIEAGLLEEGLVAVQDESAGLVSQVLDPQPGEYILDACAAPCGKTIHSGLLMRNEGRLIGIDVNAERLQRGLRTALKHGLSIMSVLPGDFSTMTPSEAVPMADRVLIDAPCTGLGVLARRPDLRWRRDETAIRELVELQDRLLDAAALFVAPGGYLVYSTCTITPEENEDRVEAFLQRHPGFAVDALDHTISSKVVAGDALATLPHRDGMDGAFAVRLIKG